MRLKALAMDGALLFIKGPFADSSFLDDISFS